MNTSDLKWWGVLIWLAIISGIVFGIVYYSNNPSRSEFVTATVADKNIQKIATKGGYTIVYHVTLSIGGKEYDYTVSEDKHQLFQKYAVYRVEIITHGQGALEQESIGEFEKL